MFRCVLSAILVLISATGVSTSAVGVPRGAGERASLSEKGYQRVSTLKDDEEMKVFIRRILASTGDEVSDEGELSGFVPHYSGVLAVQDFAKLKQELHAVSWISKSKSIVSKSKPSKNAKAEHSSSSATEKHQALRGEAKTTVSKQAEKVAKPVAIDAPSSSSERKQQRKQVRSDRAAVTQLAAGVPKASLSVVHDPEELPTVKNLEETRTVPLAKPIDSIVARTQLVEHSIELESKQSLLKRIGSAVNSTLNTIIPANDKEVELGAHASFLSQPAVVTDKPANKTMPHLPEVSSVLSKASETLGDFTQQAEDMQRKVSLQQASSRAAVAAKKAEYEHRLSNQRKAIMEANATNDAIRKNISVLHDEIRALEKKSELLQTGNTMLRKLMHRLNSKISLATDFLGDSLNVTDDREAEELSVLVKTTPKPTLDYFLNAARSELGLSGNRSAAALDDEMSSLLAVSSQHQARVAHQSKTGGPQEEQLISLLGSTLSNLAKMEEQGKEQMKVRFQKVQEVHDKKMAELETVHKSLVSLVATLETRKSDLIAAVEYLKSQHERLRLRVHGFEIFAQKIDAAIVDTMKVANEVNINAAASN